MKKRTTSGADKSDLRRQRIKLGASVAVLVAAGALAWVQLSGETPAEAAASRRLFLCSDCKQTFRHAIEKGQIQPLKCDHCGQLAAYMPEACYWTKDSAGRWTSTDEPTYVILKSRMELEGKTYCPDCGHEVWGHFAKPTPQDIEKANRKPDVDEDEGE